MWYDDGQPCPYCDVWTDMVYCEFCGDIACIDCRDLGFQYGDCCRVCSRTADGILVDAQGIPIGEES